MLSDEILARLKTDMSASNYARYIASLQYDEKQSDEDTMVFFAPNIFIRNFVKSKYSTNIIQHAELLKGRKIDVRILVKNENITPNHALNVNIHEKMNENIEDINLNPSYTFESFIVGKSNEVAFAVAKSIAEKSAINYNPFFLYGPTGLGKTHLIQAIGNHAKSKGKKVIYTTSEQFLNDFISNVYNKSPEKFKKKYRQCDILLIDDIQFLANKIQTQNEFFHTFNDLRDNQKQVVLTSDKPPKMINGFEERLKSRFEWGMISEVTHPELETKIAIIQKKCEIDKIYLNTEVIEYIASNMGDNIREIESAIINLNANANILGHQISLEFAKDVLKIQLKEQRENINLDLIIEIISRELNIKPSEIKSKKRSKNILEARRIGIYLARTMTPNSMPELANFFGLKDHSSVSKNMKQIESLLHTDEYFKLRVDEIKNKVLTK